MGVADAAIAPIVGLLLLALSRLGKNAICAHMALISFWTMCAMPPRAAQRKRYASQNGLLPTH